MSESGEYKKYEPFKIPGRQGDQGDGRAKAANNAPSESERSLSDGTFYEIEYGSHPIPGVGRFVRKPQQIERPATPEDPTERDEVRVLFDRMRDIARAYRSAHDPSRFFDRRVQLDNAAIFYKQGMFMKDFTDDYPEKMPFSQYFPFYQLMGYKQLRTFFTWRTEVRKGNVENTSLSYAFLYIYELLNNIGVNDPQDGLDKLMFFWKAFRLFSDSIDKYVLKWLKDYHIYYELPHSFNEFIKKNDLIEYYPKTIDTDDTFDLFCAVSKYDIRKSSFFTEENKALITGCFYFLTDRLRRMLSENGIHFDDSIFQPSKKMSAWTPFRGALFYDRLKQSDRRIVLSENEIYVCTRSKWAFSAVITSEAGRQLTGYLMKKMESALRKVTSYKYRLSANIDTVTHPLVGKMKNAGLSLERIIDEMVEEYYRETTKIVVKVDIGKLSLIREEALVTQEKLTVEEQEEKAEQNRRAELAAHDAQSPLISFSRNFSFTAPQDMSPVEDEAVSLSDAWEGLKDALTETERKALSVVLRGETSMKKFADEYAIMPEVLADGINEKAMDYIGDSLLDEDLELYDEYKDHVKEMVG